MLRVLAHDALANAMLRGFERVSFHGYCIEAKCLSTSGEHVASVELMLTIGGGAELLDRVRIAVAFRSDRGSACRIDPLHASPIAARQP
jgi:hypothetical protein